MGGEAGGVGTLSGAMGWMITGSGFDGVGTLGVTVATLGVAGVLVLVVVE